MDNTGQFTASDITNLLSGGANSHLLALLLQRYFCIIGDLLKVSGIPAIAELQLKNTVSPAEIDVMRPSLDNPVSAALYTVTSAPELVLPLGFDAIRFTHNAVDDDEISDDLKGVTEEAVDAVSSDGLIEHLHRTLAPLIQNEQRDTFESLLSEFVDTLPFRHLLKIIIDGPQYRTRDGVWHPIISVLDRIVPYADTGVVKSKSKWGSDICENWISQLQASSDTHDQIISMPGLWLPGQPVQDTLLRETTVTILKELYLENKEFRDLHWRTLEEIVAELLRDLGLTVELTKRSWDDGRDVIAKGELIPGEPTILAVEVKHMPVVPVAKLREALWANRHFPAMMFATSGRFSAGIFKEQSKADSQLRLYLKDGVALGQWIAMYAKRQSWELT